MLILGSIGMYFDAAVVFFTSLFFQNGYGHAVNSKQVRRVSSSWQKRDLQVFNEQYRIEMR